MLVKGNSNVLLIDFLTATQTKTYLKLQPSKISSNLDTHGGYWDREGNIRRKSIQFEKIKSLRSNNHNHGEESCHFHGV